MDGDDTKKDRSGSSNNSSNNKNKGDDGGNEKQQKSLVEYDRVITVLQEFVYVPTRGQYPPTRCW